jgi:hypothetical protein
LHSYNIEARKSRTDKLNYKLTFEIQNFACEKSKSKPRYLSGCDSPTLTSKLPSSISCTLLMASSRLCWYVAEYWVKQLRERTAYRPSASGQAHSGEDPIPIRVLEGLNALAEFLVGESSTLENPLTDAKKRKSIYDRIPKEVVTNASTLARDLQWRARQMLAKAKEGEDEGAVAADQGQAVEAERGTKRRKSQSNGDSKANGHKRPRLKNVTAS